MPRRARRALAVAGICAAVVTGITGVTGARPAAALTRGTPIPCGPDYSMLCTGTAQFEKAGSDSARGTMVYTCTVVDTHPPVNADYESGVGCNFVGADGITYTAFFDSQGAGLPPQRQFWTPGATSTMAGNLTMKDQPYWLCVGGGRVAVPTVQTIQNYVCTPLT